jgi:hypothetical protein
MNGGANERVASYVYYADNSYLKTNGGTSAGDLYGIAKVEGTTTENREDSNKYKTVYPTSYDECSTIKGDAIYETSNSSSSSTGSWHSVYASFPYSSSPFFARGGDYNYSDAGPFFFYKAAGGAYGSSSFRPVLAF